MVRIMARCNPRANLLWHPCSASFAEDLIPSASLPFAQLLLAEAHFSR